MISELGENPNSWYAQCDACNVVTLVIFNKKEYNAEYCPSCGHLTDWGKSDDFDEASEEFYLMAKVAIDDDGPESWV